MGREEFVGRDPTPAPARNEFVGGDNERPTRRTSRMHVRSSDVARISQKCWEGLGRPLERVYYIHATRSFMMI